MSIHEELVVVAEGFIEGPPYGKFLICEDLGHRGPVHALLFLLTASIARLVGGLVLTFRLLVLGIHHVLAEVTIFTLLVELFQGWGEQFNVQPELILVNFFLLTTGLSLSCPIQSRFVACLFGVGQRGWVWLWANSTLLLLFSLFFFHAFALFSLSLLVVLLELIKHVDKELNIGHVLDAK